MEETYSSKIFSTVLTITSDYIDQNNHVNNVAYVQWMQDIAIMHSEKTGGTKKVNSFGATWVIRAHKIEYINPAFLNEELIILTWVSNIRRVSSLRKYCFIRKSDNKLIAKAETDWVLVNYKTGRPFEIPEEIHELYPIVTKDEEPI